MGSLYSKLDSKDCSNTIFSEHVLFCCYLNEFISIRSGEFRGIDHLKYLFLRANY